MSDKKNIDRLFQERFKDLESVPNEKIWNKIHDALHEKKKKKIIPLWWKLSGIAAGFILAFVAFNTLSSTFDKKQNVVIAPKEIETNDKLIPSAKTETRVAIENIDSSVIKNDSKANKNNLNTNRKTGIAAENTVYSDSENDSQTNINQHSNTEKTTKNNILSKKRNLKIKQNSVVAKNAARKTKQELIEKKMTLSEEVASNAVLEQSIDQNQLSTKTNNTEISATSIENKVALKNKISKDTDSTALALATDINPLEEILTKKKEKGEEVLAIAKLNRWQVTTNVAPVFFNSASNGSPIESQFSENSKSYENNLSVGVGVQYAVNNKISVRTGVNKVTLGYGTNDVMFFGTLNSPGVNTLNFSNATSQVEVISSSNFDGLRPFEDNIQNMESGVLNQRMGYYEVPLELSFAVINRKFGVHVIGGFSTLFLNENSVSVQSPNATLSLGKANNLNDVHFSSNIGLGLKYEFWKSFEAHFEPTFKYQFNTFSRDAGNFKPYFVGLYTGVSFKF